MIKLDESTDSILPYGLKGTPFETVYKALQAVASTVWPADASGLRASIGWAWYALNDPASLVSAASGKQFLQDVLISEQVPLVKSTQTQAELVDLLIAWLGYKPTFGQLEALYKPYAATVDIRPITDEDTQVIYPVTPVHGAFYVIVADIDLSRPLTLAEALTIAERATPMGSKPYVLYDFDAPTHAYAELGYGDVCIYAGSEVPAEVPTPPQPDESPKGYIVVNSSGRIQHGIDLDDMFIHQIQHSVDVVNFYFTSNGSAETENTLLESGVDVTLYNADGTVADDALYDGEGTLTYTQANGNMFEAADGGDLISLQSGALVINPNADYTALSVQVEEYTPPGPQVPTLTLDLCLTSDAQAVTFSANDYWFAYFSSEDDKQSALDFGLTAFGPQQNRLGGFSEGFEVEILALLDANHDVVLSDTSNFYLSFMSNENGTWAVIRSIAAYSTASVYWRLKITKPDVLTGYYKQDGSANLCWDSRRTITINHSYGDVRTCVRATEYIDPQWADQPGYGDGTREIDPTKVDLHWYGSSSPYPIRPSFNGVTIWNDSIVVIEYTLYKEMTLHTYLNENGILFGDFQPRITSNSTESDINNAYIGLLKTGTNNTGNTVSYDSSKRYELGYYNNDNIWTPFDVHSLSDMPDSTVSSGSTQGYLLVSRNGYLALWLVTNYNGGSTISTAKKDWIVRVYNK